jgi:hypothetical protein
MLSKTDSPHSSEQLQVFCGEKAQTLIQVLRVEGSKSRHTATFPFLCCPKCGDSQDLLFPDLNGIVKCSACHSCRPSSEYKVVRKKITVARCGRCGKDVPFVPSTTGVLGPQCTDFKCSNYLAVVYGKRFLDPKIVLDPAWNRGLMGRAQPISPRLLFARCRSKQDHVALTVLQVLAKQDDDRFKFGDPNEFRSALCFHSTRRKYVGFLIWTEDKTAVLRQLFVVKDERRKGHASRMVKFWVERFANKLGDRFAIEEPNATAMKLHAKLGHLRLRGSTAIGLKCSFVRSI